MEAWSLEAELDDQEDSDQQEHSDDQSPDDEEEQEEQDEEEGDDEEGDEGDEQEAALSGCDANCEGSHREDGNCLNCGNDWCGNQSFRVVNESFRVVNESVVTRGEHNGHMCTSGGHDDERGSWLVVCMSSYSTLLFVETLHSN